MNPSSPLPLVILKIASRCNLNCTYCYEYNLADSTWKDSPAFMSDEVFGQVLNRVKRHCDVSGQPSIHFSMHGGEPMLIGPARFAAFCERAYRELNGVRVRITIQTNGTLITDEWAAVLRDNQVDIGISLDGPPDVHDRLRIDHKGQGSYAQVQRGMETLRRNDVSFGILTVIQLGADPLAVHRHFLSLGCTSLSYLLPDYPHDTFGQLHERYGPTPCADFLIPIFDDWWYNSTLEVRVRNFWDMARLIMGGRSTVDALGNRPLYFVVVNSGGDIEGLDVLKACSDGLVKTGLNVASHDFSDVAKLNGLHAQITFGGLPLPKRCQACQERDTCGGGYHPHRYSHERQFDNPSVWCGDLLRLFTHIRARLEVPVPETWERRHQLELAYGNERAAAVGAA